LVGLHSPDVTQSPDEPETDMSMRSLMCAAAMVVGSGAYADYQSTVMSSQPSAYYRFEETTGNVLPSVPGGALGTINGTVERGLPSASPALGSCYRFNDGAVVLPFTTATQPGDEWSIELWAKAETVTAPAHLIGNGVDLASGSHRFVIYGGNGSSPTWRIGGTLNYSGGSGGTEASAGWECLPSRLAAWHHYAYVHSKSQGKASFYVDGQLAAISTLPAGSFVPSTAPFHIGKHLLTGSYTYPFLGLIDEVAVYKRSLPATEILAHYEAGSGTVLSVPGHYPTIQAAIDAASSLATTTIRVGPGTYSGPINLLGKPIRLESTSGAAVTTLDGTGLNASTVTFGTGSTLFTQLRGFTIRCGRGTGDYYYARGGCIILEGGSGVIESCRLTGSNGGTGYGGGIYALPVRSIVLRDVVVDGLRAWHDGGGCQVGVTPLDNSEEIPGEPPSTRALIERTVIKNCYSYNAGGLAVSLADDQTASEDLITVRNCLFAGNSAEYGSSSAFPADCRTAPPVSPNSHKFQFVDCAFASGPLSFSVGQAWESGTGSPVAMDECHVANGTVRRRVGTLSLHNTTICSGLTVNGGYADLGGNSGSCPVSTDCNGSGIDDQSELVSGFETDLDHDGRIDSCQFINVPGDYPTIQAAINSRPSDELWTINVAPGTYAGPINLLGKPIRLIGTGGAAVTTISGTGGQSQSVIRAISGEPAISLIKGFTIRGGPTGTPLPSLPSASCGGGLLVFNSQTSVQDCIFTANEAPFGGGAYLLGHAGSITNCTFNANVSQGYGGGLQLFDSSTTITGCSFTNNVAVTAGAGLHMVSNAPKLVNCTITGNDCNDQGGGISWDPVNPGSVLTLQGTNVTGNIADVIGGGIYVYPSGVASETQLVGTTVCSNAVRNISGPYQADATSTVCDCRADLNGDGFVNGVDLAIVLSNWDAVGSSADLTGDGTVNGADLGIILAAWGTCPST
jgi:hypothetical protein